MKSAPRCMPEFKKTQSKSGFVSVMLSIKIREAVILLEGEALELCGKTGNLRKLSYVELKGTAFIFAMSVNKVFKLVCSPTRNNNTGSSLDATGGKCFSNATCRADDQNFLVGPRHSVIRVPCYRVRDKI